MQKTDRFLHTDDGRRHQSAESHQSDVLSDRRLHNGFRGDVLAQVDHIISVILQHYFYDIFADVMDIALDRGQDDPAFYFLGLSLQGLLHHFEGCLGSFRAHEELRQEHCSLLKPFANLIQRRDQFPVDQIQCGRMRKCLSGRFCGALRHSPDDALSEPHG